MAHTYRCSMLPEQWKRCGALALFLTVLKSKTGPGTYEARVLSVSYIFSSESFVFISFLDPHLLHEHHIIFSVFWSLEDPMAHRSWVVTRTLWELSNRKAGNIVCIFSASEYSPPTYRMSLIWLHFQGGIAKNFKTAAAKLWIKGRILLGKRVGVTGWTGSWT